MNRLATLALAALLLSPAVQAAAARKKKAARAAAPSEMDVASDNAQLKAASAVDKKRFEAYLRDRLGKIEEHHKTRMDFLAKEAETWNSFWNKIRDERKIFEVRITRQTMDLFESLASLDPRDQPQTIADFEKMQGNVIKSFEMQQKQKTDEFFAAREARWKDFAAGQEQEREQFLAEAESDWQQSKQALRNPQAAAATPEDQDGDGEADVAQDDSGGMAPVPRMRPSRKRERPAPAPARPIKVRRADPNDNWH